jgi:hypothetical protein
MERDVIFPRLNTTAFVANLLAAVMLLAATLWSGRVGRRRVHYSLASATLVTLLGAIVQAEFYGRDFTFEPLRLRIHLTCAISALIAVPWVIATGWRLRTRPTARPAHRRAVGCFVVLTGLAILTAGWMFLSAEPRT